MVFLTPFHAIYGKSFPFQFQFDMMDRIWSFQRPTHRIYSPTKRNNVVNRQLKIND